MIPEELQFFRPAEDGECLKGEPQERIDHFLKVSENRPNEFFVVWREILEAFGGSPGVKYTTFDSDDRQTLEGLRNILGVSPGRLVTGRVRRKKVGADQDEVVECKYASTNIPGPGVVWLEYPEKRPINRDWIGVLRKYRMSTSFFYVSEVHLVRVESHLNSSSLTVEIRPWRKGFLR